MITGNLSRYFSNYVDLYGYGTTLTAESFHFDPIELIIAALKFMYVDTSFITMLPKYNYDFVLSVLCIVIIVNVFKYVMNIGGKVSTELVKTVSTFVYDNIVASYLNDKSDRYFRYILYIFYFILVGNLLGLIPSLFAITSQLNTTLMLSFIC
jgi:F0F1-type ATP synthase membrane subunit a